MSNSAENEKDASGTQIGSGRGKVALRLLNPPDTVEKTAPLEGGDSHQVKFSGPGDATTAHAETNDGTVLNTAQLRLIFWGREWASSGPPVAMTTVVAEVESILAGPYLDALEQYGVSAAYVSQVIDLTNEDPPNPYKAEDAANRVGSLIDDNDVPEPDEENVTAIYAVILPSTVAGQPLSVPAGILGEHTRVFNLDWEHFALNSVPVAWVSNNGTADLITEVFSHELVETLTDPDGSGWQVEPRSGEDWHEIADVCQSAYRLNGVSVSSYWSNSDNACVVPDRSFSIFDVEWICRPSRIEWLGGTDENGNAWQLPRAAVMERIRGGDEFRVKGASTHKQSLVGIYYLDATHPYLASSPDGAPDDNLLALPRRAPA